MADCTIRMADERGHVLKQVELGNAEGEVRERFAQQGYLIYSLKPTGSRTQSTARPLRHAPRLDLTALHASYIKRMAILNGLFVACIEIILFPVVSVRRPPDPTPLLQPYETARVIRLVPPSEGWRLPRQPQGSSHMLTFPSQA